MTKKDIQFQPSEQFIQSQGYTYFAFISYKREDSKWAVWLKRKLQSYRLPTKTRERYSDLPEKLCPVFLDKDNMKPGELSNQEREEVQASKFLIVICSKKACRKSKNIDDEIQFFLDGGGDPTRIIPFIVDDAPHPEQECFPLRLQELCKETNIIGTNVNDSDKDNAVLKVIAYMHGIKLEELESEEKRRKKRRNLIASVCAAALALMLGAAGFLCWDYCFPKEAYYLDYTEVNGLPVGIGELTKAETRSLNGFYTIIKQYWKIRELRHENPYGDIVDTMGLGGHGRPLHITYEYENGVLHEVTCYDKNDKPSEIREYTSPNLKTINLRKYTDSSTDGYDAAKPMDEHTIRFLSSEDDKRKSNVVRYLVDYDEKGRVSEIRYASDFTSNYVGTDSDGISGIRYERDEWGRVVRESYLTFVGDGKFALNPEDFAMIGTETGLCYAEYTYDGFDCVEMRLLNADRQPAAGVRKYSSEKCEHSGHNCAAVAFYDIDGNPVSLEEGYASYGIEYDQNGNMREVRFFGENGQPVMCAAGYSVYKSEYDEKGNLAKLSFFNTEEKPVINTEGKAVIEAQSDQKGNIIRERYLDIDGQPVNAADGFASFTAEYYDNGDVKRKNFFDADGKPVLNGQGYASVAVEYDEHGTFCTYHFFGTDGNPVLCKNGYASEIFEFDNWGNPVNQSFFGTDGNPICPTDSYSKMKTEYDERGNIIKLGYYNADDQPVTLKAGYAFIRTDYDERGNMIRVSYLDADRQPAVCPGGYATWTQAFDNQGNRTKSEFFDKNDNPVVSDLGFAGYAAVFNERGNKTGISYYGADGQLMLIDEGYAVVKMDYDDSGNMIRISYFGTDNQPINTTQGYASWTAEYNESNKLIRKRYLDADGQPALSEEGFSAKEVIAFDATGQPEQIRFVGLNGVLPILNETCHSAIVAYNLNGKVTGVSYFDEDGRPVQ